MTRDGVVLKTKSHIALLTKEKGVQLQLVIRNTRQAGNGLKNKLSKMGQPGKSVNTAEEIEPVRRCHLRTYACTYLVLQ